MTKPPPDASDTAWLKRFTARATPVTATAPAFRPQPSIAIGYVDERTRTVREITAAATKKR